LKCSPKHRGIGGFTLLESLITVFLVMLVFGLVAELLIGALKVTRFERQKVEAAEAGQLALSRMLCEVREACKIDTSLFPNELILYKFNASQTLAARSEPNRYRYTLKVRYYLDSVGTLLRDVAEPSVATETHVVADGIRGLQVVEDGTTKNIQISLTTNDAKGQLRVISSEVAPLAVMP
jgi:type II secretory pathway pseudopilin PulG